MTNPCNPYDEHDKTGGVPATPEPREGLVYVEVNVAATVKIFRALGCQDEADAKSYAEGMAHRAIAALGYEVLDIKSTLGDTA